MLGSSNRVVHMMVANHSLCPPNFCCSDPSSGLVVSGLGKGDVTMLCNICTPRSDTSFDNEEIALAVPLPSRSTFNRDRGSLSLVARCA